MPRPASTGCPSRSASPVVEPAGRRLLPQRLRVEREAAVLEGAPVAGAGAAAGGRDPCDGGATIARMSQSASTRILVPRWVQLVSLPLLLVLAWIVAGAVRHVVFLFLVALLIALLLNPLVRGLGRVWIPRGFAVALVYLAFAAVVALAILALATVVVQQTRHASHRVDSYFTVGSGHPPRTGAENDLARFQHWLNAHHLRRIDVAEAGREVPEPGRDEGRAEVHVQGAELGRGRGRGDLLAPLQRRPRDRGLDLHAPRHGAADARGQPTLPAARAGRPDRADGAGDRELREGTAAALADHRRELRTRALDPRRCSGCCRTGAATRSSSAPGRG